MRSKDNKLDERIRKRLVIPPHLPIDMNRKKYVDSALSLVQNYMRRGKSMSEAIELVNTKYYRKFDNSPVVIKNANSNAMKNILVLLLALVVAMTSAYAFFTFKGYSGSISNISSVNEMDNIKSIESDQMILLSGVDTRPEVDSGYGDVNSVPGSRTDTIAIMYVPKELSNVFIISVPRDLSVNIDNCQGWDSLTREYNDETITASDEKINSAYANGGPQCLMKTVNETFDLDINKYAEIDFNVFQKVVDEVGGVDIHTDAPIIDDTLGVIIPDPGTTRLNGSQALDYVRARKVEGTSKSDLDRIRRQHTFFMSLFGSLKNSGKSNDPLFIMSMSNLLASKMNTINMSVIDIASLMKSASSVPVEEFTVTTIPVEGDNESGNLVMNSIKTQDLFETIQSETGAFSGELSGDFYKPGDLKTKSVTVITKNAFDRRSKEIEKSVSGYFESVNSTVYDGVVDNTTVYLDKNTTDPTTIVAIASLFPNVYISSEEPPVNTPSDIVIALAPNVESVIETRNDNIDFNKDHFVPVNFSGFGYEIVPKKIR